MEANFNLETKYFHISFVERFVKVIITPLLKSLSNTDVQYNKMDMFPH